MRITEDKISARLKNFHISHDYSQKCVGEKRHETFEEIESRLSSDEEDLDLDLEQPESSGEVIQVSKELKDMVKNKLDERLLLLPPSVPNSCSAVVLWQPSPWENLLPKPQKKELLEKLGNSEELTRKKDDELNANGDTNAMEID
uniref:Uncharacterized protein n=1 Tax=Romanomermis culicivorax TaxID=13658 RepID=A0A915I2J1_ROMCU